MIEEIDNPVEVIFPLKCTTKNRDKIINNEKILQKNTNTLLEKCKKK